MTISGFLSNRVVIASFTQSAGVPLMLQAGVFSQAVLCIINGLAQVIERPLPDFSCKGATMATSAKGRTDSHKWRRPLAEIPSSFVMSKKGRFFIL